jgi:hypothetical protein
VTVTNDRLPRPVDGTLTLDGSSIVLAADGVPSTYSIPLPPLIQGLSYDSLTVSRDSAELHFSLGPGRLRAPTN